MKFASKKKEMCTVLFLLLGRRELINLSIKHNKKI